MNHLVPQQPVMFKDIQKHRHQTHGFPLQLDCIIPLTLNPAEFLCFTRESCLLWKKIFPSAVSTFAAFKYLSV